MAHSQAAMRRTHKAGRALEGSLVWDLGFLFHLREKMYNGCYEGIMRELEAIITIVSGSISDRLGDS